MTVAAWRNLRRTRGIVPVLAALILGVGVWQSISLVAGPSLPSPAEFVNSAGEAVGNRQLYIDILVTSRRVFISWPVAAALGSAIAIWMGRSRIAEGIILPWVLVALALPSPVIILFAILLFGIEEMVALTSLVAAVTPFTAMIVLGGVKAIDANLVEMARVYQFGRTRLLREVMLPSLAPSLLSGARFGFTLSWKLVMIMEALSRSTGVGARVEYFFRVLRPADVLVWTTAFAIIMILVELCLLRPAAKYTSRWRDA